ncbi:MAG: WG repeat-containing protein [Terrimonas ferruginea]|uniref:WG repeat-containing protein n=1 Tax=Terrimonas ferruginea TaxID=249 RepID=UPI00092C6BA6|nr:WG repeat-containing protein [Terrimonas ferruginea]MBN8783619.1 WG repeat-containing protein [Terrimonas ferruginea]OJW40362.1 MAG: hypothetical protein BGO56_09990 [Sphingobacteriales bacterium 48-107]
MPTRTNSKIKMVMLLPLVLFSTTLVAQDVLVPFRVKDKWGYSDLNGKIKIKPRYDYATFFDGDYAKAYEGTRTGLINKSGKTIIPFHYRDLQTGPEGVIAETADQRTGFYDLRTRKLVIDTQYSMITPVVEGLLLVVNDLGKQGIFDSRSKKWIAPAEYDYASPMADPSKVIVGINGKVFTIDVLANGPGPVTPYKEDQEIELEDLKTVTITSKSDADKKENTSSPTYTERLFREKNKYGFVFEGQFAGDSIPAMYDSIDRSREYSGYLGVKNMARWGIINSKNEIVLRIEYPPLDMVNSDPVNGFYVVLVNGKKTVISQNGSVLARDYDQVTLFQRSYILEKDKKQGLLILTDKNAPVLIEPAFLRVSKDIKTIYPAGGVQLKFWYGYTEAYPNAGGYISEKGVRFFQD